MSQKIGYSSDKEGQQGLTGEVQGSDGRINTSSRSDSRFYYNSRDTSQAYSLTWDDASTSAADYVLYIRNDRTDGKHLVIRSIGFNSDNTGVFKLWTTSGTASGPPAVTPACLNRAKTNSATVTALTAVTSASTPLALTSVDLLVDIASIGTTFGHEEFRLRDGLRLGEDQAIAIELDTAGGDPDRTWGTIFFYFE